jgi:glycosyltransferase involved in cell wall biosynthesis
VEQHQPVAAGEPVQRERLHRRGACCEQRVAEVVEERLADCPRPYEHVHGAGVYEPNGGPTLGSLRPVSGLDVSFVCTSLDRRDEIERMIRSIVDAGLQATYEIIVVDQSSDGCLASLDRPADPTVHVVASGQRGSCVGRNVGLRVASGDVVAFPDDDSWYLPGALAAAVAMLAARPELAGMSFMGARADGVTPYLRFPRRAGWVTRADFDDAAIEWSILLRRSALDDVGGFADDLGIGAPRYRSGGVSDLVLRLLDHGHRLWFEPMVIAAHPDPELRATVARASDYGYGLGEVYRRHRVGPVKSAWTPARRMAGAGRRAARRDWQGARQRAVWSASFARARLGLPQGHHR